MPRSPQDIYARHLVSPRGYPLWTPEPSQQLLSYRRDGLRIGDVGVVIPEDGCFDVFFNICLPADHPFHRATGVPDNFKPIILSDMDIRTVVDAENPGRILANPSVKRARTVERPAGSSSRTQLSELEYEFTLSSGEGALLILPEGAQRHDLRNYHRFLEVATQHGADWYRFAEERVGLIIGNDSLYLITGLYKTTSWSLAAFEKTAGRAEYPAQFRVAQADRNNVAAAYTWDTTRALDWRAGPTHKYEIPNQAVFIRGFKIALRSGIFGTRWIRVKADGPSTRLNPARSVGTVPGDSRLAYMFGDRFTSHTTQSSGSTPQDEVAGNSVLDDAQNEIQNNGALAVGEHVVIQRVPEVSQAFHPSDIINQYLLNEEPSANIAITHDDVWITMLEEDLLQPEDLAQEGRLETLVSQRYSTISGEGAVYLQSQRDSESDTSSASEGLESDSEPLTRADVGALPDMERGALWPQMVPPPMGPYTPAAWPMPPGMSPHPVYAAYMPWQHPTQQPPPIKIPGAKTAQAAVQWTNNADRMGPFAEGPHYGPVLEPFLAKIVGACIKVNPLLAPPSDTQDDYLRWNMLFHTGNCYRTTESHRSWVRGRNAPATHPRVTYVRIISRAFPWMIHARAHNPKLGVTCGEVLDAISTFMYGNVAKKEYEHLPSGRKWQIREGYRFNRSTDHNAPGGCLGESLKRLDWLGATSRFGGLVTNDTFVMEHCGDVLPCIFELKCLPSYPLTAQEVHEQQQRLDNPPRRRSRSWPATSRQPSPRSVTVRFASDDDDDAI